jgi:GNAT superfamily N-acetyltransferase
MIVKKSKEIIIKLVLAKLMEASSALVVPYDFNKFKNKKIEVSMEHRSEYLSYPDGEEWEDEGYNYRLGGLEDIYYAVVDNKVVGHIGLDSEAIVRAVYVSPSYRRQGISKKMHLEVFKLYPRVVSDDLSAMEKEEINLWENLLKEKPDQIKKLEDGSFLYTF